MVEEGIKRNPESTKAQAQPGWRSAERPRCFLDLPTMVPASASRTQPFIWLALSLTFINLFDCVFTNCICWLQATPPKDTKHYWQYHNSEDAQKNHIKETLLQPTLLEDTTYIWQYIRRFFHQISSLTHTFTDTQLSPVPIMTSPWESSIVTLSDSHNSVPLAPNLRRQLIFPFKMNLDLKMTHFLACYDKTNGL